MKARYELDVHRLLIISLGSIDYLGGSIAEVSQAFARGAPAETTARALIEKNLVARHATLAEKKRISL